MEEGGLRRVLPDSLSFSSRSLSKEVIFSSDTESHTKVTKTKKTETSEHLKKKGLGLVKKLSYESVLVTKERMPNK